MCKLTCKEIISGKKNSLILCIYFVSFLSAFFMILGQSSWLRFPLLSFQTPKKSLHVSFEPSPRHERSVIGDDNARRSLLGYDWIAGLLDNTSYLSERPDDFFDDLKEFRRVNKKDCFGNTLTE